MDKYAALSDAVWALLAEQAIVETISRLKRDGAVSAEPFVWASLDLTAVTDRLPDIIRSGWIFVLKKETWSGAHFHPNSVQHMVVIEGHGRSSVGGVSSTMSPLDPDSRAPAHWFVIEAGVPHEFYPIGNDMVVISFHTCSADELVEVSAMDGRSRTYTSKS